MAGTGSSARWVTNCWHARRLAHAAARPLRPPSGCKRPSASAEVALGRPAAVTCLTKKWPAARRAVCTPDRAGSFYSADQAVAPRELPYIDLVGRRAPDRGRGNPSGRLCDVFPCFTSRTRALNRRRRVSRMSGRRVAGPSRAGLSVGQCPTRAVDSWAALGEQARRGRTW